MPRRHSLALLLAALLGATLSSAADAAAVRWNNAGGGNWSAPANWLPAAVPTASDTAVIDLAGTYTVTIDQNVSIAGFRVNGSASGVQTVTASSRTLTFAGAVTLGAQSVVNWSSCTVNGAGAITNEGTLTRTAGSVAQAFANSGTLVVISSATQNGALTTAAGSTLRVQGNASFNSTLTVANGFTNNGTVELTSSAATSATLAVTAGTLVNAPGAQILSLAGSGGARNLTARLDNQGVITVSQALTTNKASVAHTNSGTIDVTGGDYTIVISGTTPSFTTGGTINVASGRTLTLQGGVVGGAGQNYYYTGGTLGGAGTVALLNSTLNLSAPLSSSMARLDGTTSIVAGPSAFTVAAGTTVPMFSSNLTGPVVVDAGGTLQMTASDVGGSLANSGTVNFISSCLAPGSITTVAGSTLRVLGTASYNSTLTAANGFTNNATIELTSSAATSATLNVTTGPLVNAPGAQILSLPGSGGARNLHARLDNQGVITVSQALTTNKASVGHVNSGTIDVTGADYTIVISGTVPSFTTNGTINVASGRTLTLQGGAVGGAGQNYYYAGGTLGGAGTVALLNSTLNLTSALSSAMARLEGTTSILAGPSTFTVAAGTTVPMASSTISAPVIVDATGKLAMTASDLTGGTLNNGLLEFVSSCALNGSLTTGAGSVLRVLGTASYNSTLTAANGFTNSATIELTSSAATSATLSVTAGSLVNAPGGLITSLPGSGGARNLHAQLDNQGLITVSRTLTTNRASADHVNAGTIDVTGGDYTIVISGVTPTFTTSGSINVAATRTLTLQGGAVGGAGQNYYYAGGTLGGAGTVALLNSTLNLNAPISSAMARLEGTTSILAGPSTFTVAGGTTVPMASSTISAPTYVASGGTLEMTASDMTGDLENVGTVNWISACNSSGAITTVAGSVLRVLGTASYNSSWTVAGGFTNNATIELTSSAATSATLSVTAGSLVNAPGALITSLPGSGGGRNLHAQLDNQGLITVARTLTTNRASADHVNAGTIDVTGGDYTIVISGTTPTFTTSGAINVAATRTLTLQGGAVGGGGQNYYYAGGTLGGAGTVELLNSTLNLTAGIASSMARLTGNASIVAGPGTLTVSAGTTVPMFNSNITASTVVAAGGTLEMTASDQSGPLANSGTVNWISACNATGAITTVAGSTLRVLGTASYNSSLAVANGFTNNATIELTSSAATAATLNVTAGSLVNVPGATIASLAGSGGARNLGAQLDNQGTLTVSQNLTTSKASADHVNSGAINVAGGNYTIVLSGTTPSFTNTGTMAVSASRTLTLQGGVAGGAGQNYFQNGGTLGGAGTVALLNSTLNLNVPLATSFTNLTGSSAILKGPDTLRVDGGAPAMTNCVFDGPVVCTAGLLNLVNADINGLLDLRSGGTVEWRGANDFDGTFVSAPGSTARLMGNASANGSLTATVPMTNNGLFEMSSAGAATASVFSLNGTYTNGPAGTHRVLAGAAGARQMLLAFDNRGTFEVESNLTLSRAASAHVNSGSASIAATKVLTATGASFTNTPTGLLKGGGTITASGATAFAQSGTVSPGASPGRLTINATSYPCAATSVFDVEVGGDAPATGHDQVVASGPATLAGTLNVSLVGGFLPTPGHRYVVARFPSRTGTFATVNGLEYGPGQMWAVAYSDTDVVLLAMDQTWTKVFPAGTPPLARDGHAAVLDSTGDRMIVFGGRSNAGPRNDVWVLTQATTGNGSQWIALSPSGTPPAPRTNASAVYDAATNRMIVFGGDDAAGTPAVFGDAWVLTNANGLGGAPAWIALSPSGTPPAARTAHGAAYDAANNRMMVFGGNTTPAACGGTLADLWVLADANGVGSPAWTALAPSGTPPSARQFHGAAYDAASGRLLVTGGDDGCGTANLEHWALDGANGLGGPPAWTALAPAQPAPAGWAMARYAYDEAYEWLDGFGGTFGGAYTDSSWTLVGAAGGGESWHRRVFWGTRPAPRERHSMVVSSGNHVAVVFGGLTAAGRVNDVHRRDIDRGAVLDVEPGVTPPAALPRVTAFALPPSPNPARGDVALAVDVARDQNVDLDVYDLAGRRVVTLHSGLLAAGRHAFRWSGALDGGPAAPGVYLVRLHAEERTQVVRLVRLK